MEQNVDSGLEVEDVEFCDGSKGIIIVASTLNLSNEIALTDKEAEQLIILIRNKLNSRF